MNLYITYTAFILKNSDYTVSHLSNDPVAVHATSQHSFKYDGQSNNMT